MKIISIFIFIAGLIVFIISTNLTDKSTVHSVQIAGWFTLGAATVLLLFGTISSIFKAKSNDYKSYPVSLDKKNNIFNFPTGKLKDTLITLLGFGGLLAPICWIIMLLIKYTHRLTTIDELPSNFNSWVGFLQFFTILQFCLLMYAGCGGMICKYLGWKEPQGYDKYGIIIGSLIISSLALISCTHIYIIVKDFLTDG